MAVLCAAGHCAFRATDERGSGRVGSVSERESVVFGHLEGFAVHVRHAAAGPVIPSGCFPQEVQVSVHTALA